MKTEYHHPHQSISDFVITFLILEGSSQPDADHLPIFTNGMTALLCRTQKDKAGIDQLVQLTLFSNAIPDDVWVVDENTTLIACFFKPFALATLFNLPASQLAKMPVDLGNWNAHKTNALKIQLHYSNTTAQKVEVLNHLLIQQWQENRKQCEIIQYITDKILYQPDAEILSTIQEDLNLNERTFQRMFKKFVGVTPNQYKQICRFQHSFTQLKSEKFDSLADVAYDNGFADQSHFIRTFREFTKVTPNHYLKSGLKVIKP